jgi:hypothetical protein
MDSKSGSRGNRRCAAAAAMAYTIIAWFALRARPVPARRESAPYGVIDSVAAAAVRLWWALSRSHRFVCTVI